MKGIKRSEAEVGNNVTCLSFYKDPLAALGGVAGSHLQWPGLGEQGRVEGVSSGQTKS